MTVPGGGAGPGAGAADAPLRVLVVDDDEVDRLIVRRGLARAGVAAEVRETGTVGDALGLVAAETFDCVFLDYNLPGGDGLTLLRGIRRAGLDVPVVMLTGQGDEQVAVELMKAGATDYLPKGALTPDRLAHSLRYAVELARAAAAARRAEAELRESAERTRFLAEASTTLAGSLDVRSTLERAVRLAVPDIADYCMGYLADPAGRAAGVAAAHRDPARDAEVARAAEGLRPTVAGAGSSLIAEALRSGHTQHARMTDELLARLAPTPALLAALRALGPRDVLVVPFGARGRAFGALILARVEGSSPLAPADVALAEELAARAAVALDNARLFEEAERARARTERLQQATAQLVGALSLDDVAGLFVTQLREALHADSSWIALVDAESGVLTARAHAGFAPADVEPFRRIPLDAAFPSRDILRDGAPRFFESKAALFAAYPVLEPGMRDLAQEAVAVLPLEASAGLLGVATLGFRAPRAFPDEDRAFALALARQCAQAVERARLYEEAQAARAEAEASNRAKSEFLARMSHDLRTPLNAIGGYAQLIELGVHGPVTEAQGAGLARIRRAQEHLLTLINDILSFAKLEAGQVRLDVRAVPLQQTLADAGALLEPQARAKGLRFEWRAAPDGLLVRADPERLQQVLANLLGNAVKFTAAGGLVRLDWDEPEAQRVRVTVRDTGRGIPADRLEAIFDPFVQVGRTPAVADAGGVGLGLAIGRELTRAMGGSLEVESEVGVGSTFAVTLERAQAAE